MWDAFFLISSSHGDSLANEMMDDELACIVQFAWLISLSLSDLKVWCLEIGIDGNLVIWLSRVGYGGTYRPTRETERQSDDRPDE